MQSDSCHEWREAEAKCSKQVSGSKQRMRQQVEDGAEDGAGDEIAHQQQMHLHALLS